MATELAADYDFDVPQGGLFNEPFQYCDDDEVGIDLTAGAYASATVILKIKSLDEATTYASLTNGNGGVTTDSDGFITFIMLPTTTAAFSFTDLDENNKPVAIYDDYLLVSATDIRPLLKGKVRLTKRISD